MNKDNLEPLNPAESSNDPVLPLHQRAIAWVRGNLLFVLTILSVVLGLIFGIIIQVTVGPKSYDTLVVILDFPGELLLRMLKCIILPLVVASVITGLAQINPRSSGKIGGIAVLYYVTTTIVAAILGLIMVSAIRPGRNNESSEGKSDIIGSRAETNTLDTILDLFRGAFPHNIIYATFAKQSTVLTKIAATTFANGTEKTEEYLKRSLKTNEGMNMIGVIVFSIILGVIMSLHPKESKPLMKLFQSLNDVTMYIVELILWYSPIGIFFLIAAKFASVGDFAELAAQLGLYMTTVLLGIGIHFFIILPTIFVAVTRRNPLTYYANMLPAIATAFGTDSSSATMPVTLRCVEENNGIDKRISRFVIPVGATINMDGTALYEAVACVFIAQTYNIDLGFGGLITTAITATLAAVGAAGIPSAGLVTMVMVLNAVNLPLDMISVLLTVDWFLDRFRTITNVMGDAIGCAVVQKVCQAELDAMNEAADEEKEEEVNVGNAMV